jgi:hypothetical protein
MNCARVASSLTFVSSGATILAPTAATSKEPLSIVIGGPLQKSNTAPIHMLYSHSLVYTNNITLYSLLFMAGDHDPFVSLLLAAEGLNIVEDLSDRTTYSANLHHPIYPIAGHIPSAVSD